MEKLGRKSQGDVKRDREEKRFGEEKLGHTNETEALADLQGVV